jgi:hypothetical protein
MDVLTDVARNVSRRLILSRPANALLILCIYVAVTVLSTRDSDREGLRLGNAVGNEVDFHTRASEVETDTLMANHVAVPTSDARVQQTALAHVISNFNVTAQQRCTRSISQTLMLKPPIITLCVSKSSCTVARRRAEKAVGHTVKEYAYNTAGWVTASSSLRGKVRNRQWPKYFVLGNQKGGTSIISSLVGTLAGISHKIDLDTEMGRYRGRHPLVPMVQSPTAIHSQTAT